MFRLHPACISCLVKGQMEKAPAGTPDEKKAEYMQRVLKIIGEAPKEYTAPVVVRKINQVQKEMFGMEEDYSEIKKHFNEVMLAYEAEVQKKVEASEEPLMLAMQYAMIGNYIDFGAMYQVDQEYLTGLLDSASEKGISRERYDALQRDLAKAKKLVYLTDNCGEIVMDKVLIRLLGKLYPQVDITVIVRGAPVSNDATMEDAQQVRMTDMVKVIHNGNGIAGTWLPELSQEARTAMESADVLIAKGQANYETLRKCGMNIYYLFLCKCQLFAEWFRVPKFTGMLINDRDC